MTGFEIWWWNVTFTPQHPQAHTFSLYGNSHSQQV